jgi:hypothetical protein
VRRDCVTDVEQAVVEFLLAQANLVTVVDDRIWGGRDVPPPGYKPADGQGICCKTRGGGVDYSDALFFPSVQFKCYGVDEVAAALGYRALFDVLHSGSGATLRWARCEVLGQPLREPDAGWPFVLTFFRVSIRSEEV